MLIRLNEEERLPNFKMLFKIGDLETLHVMDNVAVQKVKKVVAPAIKSYKEDFEKAVLDQVQVIRHVFDRSQLEVTLVS